MRQRLLWVLIAFASIPLIACAGTLTMTTYYPAPTGYYDYLQANNIGVGTVNVGGHLQVAGYSGGSAYLGPACGVGDGSEKYTGINLNGVSNPSDCNNYNLLSGAGDNQLYINRPTGKNIYLRENNYTQLFLQGSSAGNAGGNIGIGIETPLSTLHLANGNDNVLTLGNFSQYTQNSAIQFAGWRDVIPGFYQGASIEPVETWTCCNGYPAGGYAGVKHIGLNFNLHRNDDWTPTAKFTAMSITYDGKVGIGNTAPAEALDVAGAIRSSGDIYTTNTVYGGVYAQTKLEKWGLMGAGAIYIEPAKGANLYLTDTWAGTGELYGEFGDYDLRVGAGGYRGPPPGLYFNGNLGIGLTTPAHKLHVAGSIHTVAADNASVNLADDGWYDIAGKMIGVMNLYAYTALCVRNNQSDCSRGGGVGIGPFNNPNLLVQIGSDTNYNTFFNTGGNFSIGSNDTSTYKLYVNGSLGVSGDITTTGGAFLYSDRRLKENIHPIKDPLAKVMALNGVTFVWKKNNRASVGLIAQDVEKVFPQLVNTDKEGMKSVAYQNLVALLIEAAKEQQKEISALKKEVAALKKKN